MLSRGEKTVTWVILLVFTVVTLYPLMVLVSTALEPLNKGGLGISFVHSFSLSSFSYAWSAGDFSVYMRNTVIVTASVVVISALASVMAAYGIAQLRLRGSNMTLYVAILGFMLPTEALIVPLYYQFRSTGLLNTLWAMILPQAAQSIAFGVFWMTTAFRSLPRSLVEAAVLDGASHWRLLWKVLVPNVSPAIRTMAALVFLWTWNSFLLPLVMVSDPSRYVVTVGLSAFQGAHFSNYGALAAGSILTALPVVVVYLFSQRSFIAGMFAGSVIE